MDAAHDLEAAALLRMEWRATEELGQPQREALRVLLARVPEQREQQGIGEDALVEARGETLEGGQPAGECIEASIRRIGTVRFELTTPRSQSACATRLRHVPLRIGTARGG